jgi:hypothetical protein
VLAHVIVNGTPLVKGPVAVIATKTTPVMLGWKVQW